MKKRAIKMMLLIISLLLIIVFEYVQTQKNEIEMTSIWYIREDYKKGDQIKVNDLGIYEMPTVNVIGDMIMTSKDISGQYLSYDIESGMILTKHLIQEESPVILKNDQRLITVKCSMVESNGWYNKDYDLVDLILVNSDDTMILEDATIIKRFSDTINSQGKPEFYSFIVTEQQAVLYFNNIKNGTVYVSVK